MAAFDLSDMICRVQKWLPQGWFPNSSTDDSGVVYRFYAQVVGIATVLKTAWTSLSYAADQTRLADSSDGFLDLFAYDFFGTGLPRRSGELDDAFRARIKSALLPDGGTRAALIAAIEALGCTVTVIEPSNPTDTGGWDTPFLGWDSDVGAWGDVLPYQAFVTVTLPVSGGVSNYAGYAYGTGAEWAAGGWDAGSFGWIDGSMIANQVTQQDVFDAINRVRPVNSIIWTAFA